MAVLKTILLILLALYGMNAGTGAPKIGDAPIIETESGDTAMLEQLTALEGITADKARSIASFLRDAGIADAGDFCLTPKGSGYALTFQSGGAQYTAILSRGLLFRRLMDENGRTVYGVVM